MVSLLHIDSVYFVMISMCQLTMNPAMRVVDSVSGLASPPQQQGRRRYPRLDRQSRTDISTLTQLLLSQMYSIRQAMSLQDAVHFARAHSRKEGNFIPKLVPSKYWDTTIAMLIIGFLVFTITNHSETDWKINAWKTIIFPALTSAAMYPLEESIHFATNRHLSKTVLNEMISCTAGMQTRWTKWSDNDQAFNNKHVVANSDDQNRGSSRSRLPDTVPSSGAALRLPQLIRRST